MKLDLLQNRKMSPEAVSESSNHNPVKYFFELSKHSNYACYFNHYLHNLQTSSRCYLFRHQKELLRGIRVQAVLFVMWKKLMADSGFDFCLHQLFYFQTLEKIKPLQFPKKMNLCYSVPNFVLLRCTLSLLPILCFDSQR